jgi:uncharacterized protein (DUF2235 family)
MPGKNIVLLSDGTGNSAAKLFKTNVWRLYDALDLADRTQIALYDNGVGTSAFKPLALLGGAFGWGLKRNVRDLYEFLCRNYVKGDRIFAFGFSRGAFTIRVLVGLVASQGVITGRDGRALTRLATWAYRHYRRRYNQTGVLVSVLRALRDRVLAAWDRRLGREPYAMVAASAERPDIEFLGLWDTVAAYGLPIDELTRGWDEWVWPLTLPGRRPPSIVKKACHALALDDERQTFHPMLWDESGETVNNSSQHLDEERISQVWFAGMHSNVGGGYPDDTLAHVSLCWIAAEAAKRRLQFATHLRASGGPIPDAWVEKASAKGPLSDSRRGLGGYYRYNPRHLGRLTTDPVNHVMIGRPKIHESVVERMRDGTDAYAPIVLPRDYAMVSRDGTIRDGAAHPVETATQSQSRSYAQEAAWNLVWQRRVVYFTTVAASLVLAALPLSSGQSGIGLLNGNFPALSAFVTAVGGLLPSLASPWVSYYAAYPLQLIVGALVLTTLLLRSASLQRRITDQMRAVWWPIISAPPQQVQASPAPADWIYRLRTHWAYRASFAFLNRRLLPTVFGVAMLAAMVAGLAVTIDHIVFGVASASGLVCRDAQPVAPPGGPWSLEFRNDRVCHATGIPLEAATRYRIEIKLPDRLSGDPPDGTDVPGRTTGVWMDGRYAVGSPAGLASDRALAYALAWPLKRALSVNWFVPIARVGATGGQYHALDATETMFTARESGQLFLYVNDAIVPCPGWDCLYRNNTGGPAKVTVTRLLEAGPR